MVENLQNQVCNENNPFAMLEEKFGLTIHDFPKSLLYQAISDMIGESSTNPSIDTIPFIIYQGCTQQFNDILAQHEEILYSAIYFIREMKTEVQKITKTADEIANISREAAEGIFNNFEIEVEGRESQWECEMEVEHVGWEMMSEDCRNFLEV